MFDEDNVLMNATSISNAIMPEHWLRAVKYGFDFKDHLYPSLWDKQKRRYYEIINGKEVIFRLYCDHTQKDMVFIYADAYHYKPNDVTPFKILGKAIIVHTLSHLTIPNKYDTVET